MEPCLFRHGKSGPHGRPGLGADEVKASMEPCLFRHGKGVSRAKRPRWRRLQWSHVFSDMVRVTVYANSTVEEALQWSHVFSDMVSSVELVLEVVERFASMEPCLFRHGKRPRQRQSTATGTGFNGAMSFQTW